MSESSRLREQLQFTRKVSEIHRMRLKLVVEKSRSEVARAKALIAESIRLLSSNTFHLRPRNRCVEVFAASSS